MQVQYVANVILISLKTMSFQTISTNYAWFSESHALLSICTSLKDEQELDLYPILKLERNARVLNRIKVELRVF